MENSKDYFGEKGSQIDGSLTAFGIYLNSRYGKAREMAEMLNFAHRVARAGLHTLFEEIFYDSNADLCTFIFKNGKEPTGDAVEQIEAIASKTLAQYELLGDIGHGPQWSHLL